MRSFDPSAVARLKVRLDALPTRLPLKPYDIVQHRLDDVCRMRTRGYNLDALQSILEKACVHLTHTTSRPDIRRPPRARSPVVSRPYSRQPFAVARCGTLVEQHVVQSAVPAAPTPTSSSAAPSIATPRRGRLRS